MSVSISWQPYGNGKHVRAGSDLYQALKRAFGEKTEWHLTASDVGRLEGLSAANIEGAHELLVALQYHCEQGIIVRARF